MVIKKNKIDAGFSSKEEAAKLGYLPAVIERLSDGEILRLNSDMTYSFTDARMHNKYSYSYETLMEGHMGSFQVIGWIKDFNLDTYTKFK